jgi:hypothetical protein
LENRPGDREMSVPLRRKRDHERDQGTKDPSQGKGSERRRRRDVSGELGETAMIGDRLGMHGTADNGSSSVAHGSSAGRWIGRAK